VGDNDARKHGQPWRHLSVTSVETAVAADLDGVALASVAHARVLRAQVRRISRARGLTRTIVAPGR
jgi:hypothetical protein